MADRAPQLLEYEVGFQLVDRNDDNSKAAGLFGFKANGLWLYAPVFFINGALKGHELLYVKDRDQFVPLKENWVNHLLSKRPAELGRGVNRNSRLLGVQQPDLFRAFRAPHKYATDIAAEAAEARTKLAAAGIQYPKMADWAMAGLAALVKAAARVEAEAITPPPLVLPELLKTGGLDTVIALQQTLTIYPTLRDMFNTVYEPSTIKTALDASMQRPKDAPQPRKKIATVVGSVIDAVDRERVRTVRNKISVHRFNGFLAQPSILLDDEDRAALVRDGILIKDARADNEKSKAYAVDIKVTFSSAFTNPTDTGIYDVLLKDATTAKCLVVFAPISTEAREPWATVVRLDSPKAWLNIHPSYVFVTKRYLGWEDWFKALPDATSVSKSTGPFIVMTADGRATRPCLVRKDLGSDAEGNLYNVEFDDHASRRRHANAVGPERYDSWSSAFSFDDKNRLHLGGRHGSRLRSSGKDVYAPEDAKLVRLAAEEKPDDDGPTTGDDYRGFYNYRSEKELLLGGLQDIDRMIRDGHGSIKLAAMADDRIAVDSGDLQRPRDAIATLVAGYGFDVEDADDMVKRAQLARRQGGGAVEFVVKQAYGFPDPYLTAGAPGAPAIPEPAFSQDDFMGAGVNSQMLYENSLPVGDLQPQAGNRDAYQAPGPDVAAIGVAQDASDRGQKEVFDTSMVANLLKSTRDDAMIDRHLGDLSKGLDRVGRLLLVFYWHGDRWAEKFGDSDMRDLEDSLRNTFENLGDLTLFLKQKTVDADPAETASDIDLGAVADQ